MLNSNVLDIAIGLVVTYLALSLVVSAVNELIATYARSRADQLELGIRNLLTGTILSPTRTTPSKTDINATQNPEKPDLVKHFFEHPLINVLSKDHQKPCYIASQNFATVLMSLIKAHSPASANPSNKELPEMTIAEIRELVSKLDNSFYPKKAILALVDEAACDVNKDVIAFKKVTTQIEEWFNLAMNRVSGWYNRRTRLFLLLIAGVFVIGLNIDTVAICHQLGNNTALKESLVEAAKKMSPPTAKPESADTSAADQSKPVDLADVEKKFDGLTGLGIPLGWTCDDLKPKEQRSAIVFWITKVLGLMITVFAATLGAPFWFDILKNIMAVRGAGIAPSEVKPKPDHATTAPQTVIKLDATSVPAALAVAPITQSPAGTQV